MKIVYATLLAVLLAGCHQYSIEETQRAKDYCFKNNADLYMGINNFGDVIVLRCKQGEAYFNITDKELSK